MSFWKCTFARSERTYLHTAMAPFGDICGETSWREESRLNRETFSGRSSRYNSRKRTSFKLNSLQNIGHFIIVARQDNFIVLSLFDRLHIFLKLYDATISKTGPFNGSAIVPFILTQCEELIIPIAKRIPRFCSSDIFGMTFRNRTPRVCF